jgi:hypothetical protein
MLDFGGFLDVSNADFSFYSTFNDFDPSRGHFLALCGYYLLFGAK